MTNKESQSDATNQDSQKSTQDPLAAYRGDLRNAERKAAKALDYRIQLPGLAVGLMLVFVSLFLPHTRDVLGFDVLFDSSAAQNNGITIPERVYSSLAVLGGVMLTVGTIVSRSWLVAWVNWAFVGIGWWYSIFAIWMRQSRPPTDPGGPPSFGLILGSVGMTILLIMLTWTLFRRNKFQKALAQARREEAHNDAEAREAQQVLRTGLTPVAPEDNDLLIDDRRERARARRKKRQETTEESEG